MKEYNGEEDKENFNLKEELYSLVTKKIIPGRLADKLSKKIIENNVEINKKQLYTLVNKIRKVLDDYAKAEQDNRSEPIDWKKSDTDMKKLTDLIEGLEERVANIESGKPAYPSDNIKIPGASADWDIDPLKEVPNDPESIIVLMKWLQHLIDKCGHDNLSDILNYYVDIGWISEDAKISLIDYSQGITEDKKVNYNKTDASHLPSKDHIQSLIFIEKLKGKEFDKHFIDRIDGELERIVKKLNNHHFK